jgi:hypothetical protein
MGEIPVAATAFFLALFYFCKNKKARKEAGERGALWQL